MELITSNKNNIVKKVKALSNRKERTEMGLFFVEGLRIVEEAFSAYGNELEIVLSESFYHSNTESSITKLLEKYCCKAYVVTDKLFKDIADTITPQGVLAIVPIQKRLLEDLLTEQGLYVVLDGIRDPGNMGTIIRTADAAGFTGIIIAPGCVDPYNPKTLRATMGSVFHIPLCIVEDIDITYNMLKKSGVQIYASSLDTETNLYSADMKKGTALVIGSEADGISIASQKAADLLLKVPMPGRSESLNAAVAAGIMIYEAVRQRDWK